MNDELPGRGWGGALLVAPAAALSLVKASPVTAAEVLVAGVARARLPTQRRSLPQRPLRRSPIRLPARAQLLRRAR